MDEVPRDPGSPTQQPVQDREAFARTLMELKRRGCCVLVTGQVSERMRAAQSRQLFGDSDAPRQRVLTLTDATPSSAIRYLPADLTPTHSTVTLLDYTDDVRVITSIGLALESSTDSDETASMGDLGVLLYDAIADAIHTDTCPGELRLGIATLGILLDTDGLTATRAFIRAIRADMVDVHGMAHFHLPGSPDSETVTALEPLIDIHIELRQLDTGPAHRWHLLERGETTSWLQL